MNRVQSLLDTHKCDDAIGRPVADSSLTIQHVIRGQYLGYSGAMTHPNVKEWKVIYDKFPYLYQTSGTISHVSTGAIGSSGLGATILARTNPSRPTVVPFTLIQDLVDIPRMLKDVGRLARTPRRLLNPVEQANQFLGAKFGWLPLIDDANKLLHLQQYIHSRVGELKRLYSNEGLRRRITLDNAHGSDSSLQTLVSEYEAYALGRVSRDTQEKVYGTVRWRPAVSSVAYNPSDAELIQKAIQVCSGLTTEGVIKGAWDLLPWSWMVDWFSNVGDWLTQSSSTVPATPTHLNLMRTTTTVQKHSIIQKSQWLQDEGGVGIQQTLERSPLSGSLAGSLPTLDANRLSVLGALFVQRFKRRTFNF